MVLLTVLATGFALVAVSSAASTPGLTFSVSQVAINRGYKTSGAKKLAQSYGKYNWEISPELAAAAAKQTGHVDAEPVEHDSEYLVGMTVGTQQLLMNLDTGSADLWVLSSKTPPEQRGNHPYYTPTKSAKKLSGYTWDITYGDGASASGIVYRDQVNLGGAMVTNQAVEAAKMVTPDLTEEPYDGILGLGLSRGNTVSPVPQLTFFDNVKPTLKAPLFTADLRHNSNGAYNFGYIDSSSYKGSISYFKTEPYSEYWQFNASGYAIGSKTYTADVFSTIADTGASLMLLPDHIVKAYYSRVKGAHKSETYGGYVFPCNVTLPSFTVGIQKYRAVVPGRFINYAPAETGSSECFGGIQNNKGREFASFGDVFLKSQFVVFSNQSVPHIGFAAKEL